MSDVINKSTLRYLKSVHTPNYPTSEWLINPVLPNCEQKYWRIVSGQVKEMTTTQKESVDAAEANLLKENQKNTLVENKIREIAVEALISDGVLNADGTVKE